MNIHSQEDKRMNGTQKSIRNTNHIYNVHLQGGIEEDRSRGIPKSISEEHKRQSFVEKLDWSEGDNKKIIIFIAVFKDICQNYERKKDTKKYNMLHQKYHGGLEIFVWGFMDSELLINLMQTLIKGNWNKDQQLQKVNKYENFHERQYWTSLVIKIKTFLNKNNLPVDYLNWPASNRTCLGFFKEFLTLEKELHQKQRGCIQLDFLRKDFIQKIGLIQFET
ncbi:hypothetical protein ABPG72_021605 [Tetrahymena utriculariae]